jgi:hypothetical protein
MPVAVSGAVVTGVPLGFVKLKSPGKFACEPSPRTKETATFPAASFGVTTFNKLADATLLGVTFTEPK